MSYIVLPPQRQSDSVDWKILDEHGRLVFTGTHRECEAWLDLADARAAAAAERAAQTEVPAPEQRMTLAVFVARTIRRFFGKSSGELRFSGHRPPFEWQGRR